MVWLIIIVYCFVTAFACAYLAKEKGKDQTTWFIVGFLLGIIGILILGFSKPEKEPVPTIPIPTIPSVTKFYKPRFIDPNCPIEVKQIQFSFNDKDVPPNKKGICGHEDGLWPWIEGKDP